MPGLPSHTNHTDHTDHTDHTVIRSYKSPLGRGNVRLAGAGTGVDNVRILPVFFGAATCRQKRRRVAAGVFFLLSFDTQQDRGNLA